MIDMHCHILPNLDDGPKTIQNSIEMARMAVREGVHMIIATPHHKNRYNNPSELIQRKVDEFSKDLQKNQINLTIVPGQEIRLHSDMVNGLIDGDLQTINGGRYFLVELPFDHVPKFTDEILFNALIRGFIPILAHPERNLELYDRPQLLFDFVKMGVLSQITAKSIVGGFGPKVRKFSEEIIKSNLTHFIASDAHNCKSRAFHLTESFDKLEKKFGSAYLKLWSENVELLMNGSHPYCEPPQPIRKSKFFSLFYR